MCNDKYQRQKKNQFQENPSLTSRYGLKTSKKKKSKIKKKKEKNGFTFPFTKRHACITSKVG